MQLEFSRAKDGTQTFSVNGLFFHSAYSPSKEAEKFILSANFSVEPQYIFLVEPGLSYCNDILKKKFPDCKTICIRLFNQKLGDEANWDYVIYYSPDFNLCNYLVTQFGEDKLLHSTVLINQQAQKLFAEQSAHIIGEYKNALENAKTLLTTRQFFEKKWLINSCNFIKYANNFVTGPLKTKLPVVVCASGPSLEDSLEVIKQNRGRLFVLCLSSALSVLIKNSVKPDLILSTDGGFWAGEHLKYLKRNSGIPLAAPIEAFIPKPILKNNPILPLGYNDESSFISQELLKNAGIPFSSALRNPTVSGTGLFFAKNITDNMVFLCGLDLSPCKGFQHSQPNELELNNTIHDSRIFSSQKRTSSSRFNSGSLSIYRDWFSSLPVDQTENVFRVIKLNLQKQLGTIKDIDSNNFEKLIKNIPEEKVFEPEVILYNKARAKQTFEYVLKMLETEKWKKQIFPADFIKMVDQKRLNKKLEILTKKLRKIADE